MYETADEGQLGGHEETNMACFVRHSRVFLTPVSIGVRTPPQRKQQILKTRGCRLEKPASVLSGRSDLTTSASTMIGSRGRGSAFASCWWRGLCKCQREHQPSRKTYPKEEGSIGDREGREGMDVHRQEESVGFLSFRENS